MTANQRPNIANHLLKPWWAVIEEVTVLQGERSSKPLAFGLAPVCACPDPQKYFRTSFRRLRWPISRLSLHRPPHRLATKFSVANFTLSDARPADH